MKTAALSMSPVLEIYSWQEPGAIYNMTLDVEAVGKDRSNLVELPDAVLQTELPDEIAEIFKKPMVYPSGRDEQELIVEPGGRLEDQLGNPERLSTCPNATG
jgi:hypothetical protein